MIRNVIGKKCIFRKDTFRNSSKKRTAKAIGALLLTGVLATGMTGCGLLPEEEEAHKIQIVKENIENEYDLAMCDIRDVVLTDTVSCQYKQLGEENLSFPESNKKVAFVYVKEGDEVKAGDILVKLDIAKYEDGLITMAEEIEKDELIIKQSEEKIAFYEKRIASDSVNLLDKENYLDSLVKVRDQKSAAENEIEFAKTLMEQYQEEIDGGILRAGIDGTVSFVSDNLAGGYTMANIRVITILDSSVCGFTAQDRDAGSYMTIGEHYTVKLPTGETYETTVTSIDDGKLVFELDEPDYSISVGTRGTIDVTLGTAEQVLSVPRISVFNADDFSYVYVINENGVREMKKITTGLVGNNFVEVTGGIELYESVILR